MRTKIFPEYVDAIPANIYEFRSSYLHLWIDLDLKLMYSEWLRRPTMQEYQEVFKLVIRMVQKHAITFWIIDCNQLEGLATHEQRKIIRHLAPALMVSSLEKVALVIARNVDNMVFFEDVAEELKSNYESSLVVERFFAFNEALDWIGKIRD